MFTICSVRETLIVLGNIINKNNIDVTQFNKQGNTNNIISINNTDNIGTCDSGKNINNIVKKIRIKNIITETQYILDITNRIVNKRASIGD